MDDNGESQVESESENRTKPSLNIQKTESGQTIAISPKKLSLRLQPCIGPKISSVSTAGSVINLPTVFRPAVSSASASAGSSSGGGGGSGTGSDSKVTLYRLFNSSQLQNMSRVVRPEKFASAVAGSQNLPHPGTEQPLKRKRGRPRLNRPHELKPVLPIPVRQTPEEIEQPKRKILVRSSDLHSLRTSADESGSKSASGRSVVRFTIADLPPEQRPSFAFRRDMRKQLMMKSLDERISWALGTKVPAPSEANDPLEDVEQLDSPNKSSKSPAKVPEMKTRSGREVRPSARLLASEELVDDDDPPSPPASTPPKIRVVFNSGDNIPGIPKRGRPRKTEPPMVRISSSPPAPKKPIESLIKTISPVKSSSQTTVKTVSDEALLSEDYILRNLQFWENKRKELEKRKEDRRASRGPAKSVNVVLQNQEDQDENPGSEIMGLMEYRETNQMTVPTMLPRYRPILPRINPETAENMTPEERLKQFRQRAENEKKMRLIRGVDFVPVYDDQPEEEAANADKGDEKDKVSARLEELLQEIVEDVPDEDATVVPRQRIPVAPQHNVDIDADPPKRMHKKKKPVSHGTITDPSITMFDDPDVIVKKTSQRKRHLEEDDDDDDEPPIITSVPKKDHLARPADGSTDPSMIPGTSRDARPTPKKKIKERPPNWPFGPAAPEEKKVFRRPTKPSTKLAPNTERRLIYSLMQNAVQLTIGKQSGVDGAGDTGAEEKKKQEDVEPLNYIVLESESEVESDEEEGEEGEKKEKPPKKFSCAAVTIRLAATKKSSLVFAPPTDVLDEATKIDYDEGMDSGVEENGVLWKYPAQYFNGAKYQEIAPLIDPEETPAPEPRRRQSRAPTAMSWNAPDFGQLPANNRCPHCQRQFHDPHRLWRHLITHSDKKPFVCSLCLKGHRLPEYLSYHHRLHHSDGEELLPCPHCPKRALFYSQLEAHLLNKHNAARPFPCGQCALTFALEASLEDHVRSTHEPQLNMCDLCGLTLPDEVSRKLHRRQHAEDRPFSCSDCPDKAFKSKLLLGHHRMVEHEMERQHECHKCLKTFFFLKDMQRHMATAHSHPEPFQCSLCNQQFLRRQQLTKHMERSHRGASNRPFRCQLCGSCFPTERALERHQNNVHSDKQAPQPASPPPPPAEAETNPGKRKMFSCRYCDLLFTARSAVTQHIESVHIDTMALRCRHCRQPCLNHADLERHILDHKDRQETLQTRRPNRRLCVACGELMPSRSELERHLKEEHDELVQFMCPICGDFFLTNQLYYQHTCRQEEDNGRQRSEPARAEAYSSDEEGEGGQNHGNMESQEVEGYQEWPRRSQWPEYSREEGGHYYSGW